jgi:hypothetical protein
MVLLQAGNLVSQTDALGGVITNVMPWAGS